jgi:hypothetical protein
MMGFNSAFKGLTAPVTLLSLNDVYSSTALEAEYLEWSHLAIPSEAKELNGSRRLARSEIRRPHFC